MNLFALASALLLLVVPVTGSLLVAALLAGAAGFSLIGFQGLWLTMVAEEAGPERVGTATGLAITFVTLAIAISPPLYGAVADISGSYRAVWALLTVVAGAALLPGVLLSESRSGARSEPSS